jgi:hypothetical protein
VYILFGHEILLMKKYYTNEKMSSPQSSNFEFERKNDLDRAFESGYACPCGASVKCPLSDCPGLLFLHLGEYNAAPDAPVVLASPDAAPSIVAGFPVALPKVMDLWSLTRSRVTPEGTVIVVFTRLGLLSRLRYER